MSSRRGYATRIYPSKGWHEMWAERLMGAACRGLPGLPWTGSNNPDTDHEEPPTREELRLMRSICDGCPVRLSCAEYALDDEVPAQGGMYAGVWIPWQPANGATEPSNRTKGWIDARTTLRRLRQYLQYDALMLHREHAQIHARGRNHRRLSLTTGRR